MTLTIIRDPHPNVSVKYEMQEPPVQVLLDRWYKGEAKGVVVLAIDADNSFCRTYIPTTSEVGISQKITEDLVKKHTKPGEWILFDLNTEKTIYSSMEGYSKDGWFIVPKVSTYSKDNFCVYLAGSLDGEFMLCYGANRNSPLLLFAQCRTSSLAASVPQTDFGKELAIALTLARYKLPQLDSRSGWGIRDLACRKQTKTLPLDCTLELARIDTNERQMTADDVNKTTLPETVPLPGFGITVNPAVKMGYLELDTLLDTKLEGLEDGLAYPCEIGIDSSACAELFVGVDKMFLTDIDAVTVHISEENEQLVENLCVILDGFEITVKSPTGMSIYGPPEEDDDETLSQ